MHNQNQTSSILALDVGEKRIGIAHASLAALLPHPLITLKRTAQILHDMLELCTQQRAVAIVVGLPRGMEGQSTAQTRAVEAFGHTLEEHLSIPLYWQDEAVTSKQAEEELRTRGKSFVKGDVDALAATYILEDFLREHKELFA